MYIRTKDGVYKVSHYNDWATHKRKGATLIDDDKTSYIKNENIIAQSENLELLCDGFYIDEGNEFSFYEENVYEDFEEAKEVFKKDFDNTSTLYGFIKTSKGLIYVAKMNSDGKLVLI